MKPSKERMTELWEEMKGWPAAECMAFALQLTQACMDENRVAIVDAGFFDPVAVNEVYLLSARGAMAEDLKSLARNLLMRGGGRGMVLKLGSRPTPLSEHISADPSPATRSNFEPVGTRFYDVRSGRSMMLVRAGPDAGWICYRHPDGQWVTLRKASDQDLAVINQAVAEAHHAG